jgi:hypothetical protein
MRAENIQRRPENIFYFLLLCELSDFACHVLFFRRVPSNQKESSPGFLRQLFFLRRKMSYYGGTELSELPETACGVNYMYDSDGSKLGSIL